MDIYVCSARTIRPEDHPDVTVVADAEAAVADLRKRPGKDIWLMGGGKLFRSLLGAELVDARRGAPSSRSSSAAAYPYYRLRPPRSAWS